MKRLNSLIQVYTVAGSAAQRQSLERFLDNTPGMRNLGSGNLSSVPPRHADLILAELLAGEVPQQSLQNPPHWVALVEEARSQWVQQNWGGGLRAILPRQASEAEVEAALQAVSHGLVLTHPEFLTAPAPATASPLSAREHEVLALMAEGRSNAGIAHQLWVTEGTVEKHVRSILSKLNLPDTGEDHRRVLAVITFLDSR